MSRFRTNHGNNGGHVTAIRAAAPRNINGHEYLKCQLRKAGIAHQALDNGVLSCSRPERLQELSVRLTAEKIDALLCK
jgi:hypothetical protein